MSFHKSCFAQSWKTKALKDIQKFRKAVDNHDFKVGQKSEIVHAKLEKLEETIRYPKTDDEELEEWTGDIAEDLDSFGSYLAEARENPEAPLDDEDFGRWESYHYPEIQDRMRWITEKIKLGHSSATKGHTGGLL